MTITPTAFASPVTNPATGGSGFPVPYVSTSSYQFAPTAIDTTSLVPGGSDAAQQRALADTLARASAWADRICFGMDAASKGASLCATSTVETDLVRIINGEARLVCDYKPIISVTGVDIGADAASLTTVGSSVASRIRFGRRTIYVPLNAFTGPNGDRLPFPLGVASGSRWQVVWQYVNGYPHTSLAATVSAGASSLTVAPTDGGTGLLGIIPGVTQMTLVDGADTEQFTVATVSGTTITTVNPLLYTHTKPGAPDFLPVTCMPSDVTEAVILLATTLIKTRGDNSLVLAEVAEPRQLKQYAGDEFTDLGVAMQMLAPFRVRVKAARH